MNKWYVLLLSCIVSYQAEATLIHSTIHVQESAIPKGFSFTLSASSDHSDATVVRNGLNTLAASVKKAPSSSKCSGGGINVYPQYNYQQSKRIFAGYIGSTSYTCEFDQPEDVNRFVDALKVTSEVKVSEGAITPIITAAQRKEYSERLEKSIVEKAKEDADRYGRYLGEKCVVKTLTLNAIPNGRPIVAKSYFSANPASRNVEAPLEHDESIEMDGAVEFECASR